MPIKSLKTSGTRGAGKFSLLTLLFLIVTDLAIFLNIPILREVLGFFFFTIIPGLLILRILRLNRLGLTEKIVLSVGLSIAFLMFAGLFINWAYFGLGYDTPLSTISLVLSFSTFIILLGVIAYVRNKDFSFDLSDLRLGTRDKAVLLVPSLFPLLGILGVHLMNTINNNAMLLVLLCLIPAYCVLIVMLRRQIPESVYPAIILMISVPLALLMSLRSNYIIGMDVNYDYHLFQLVSNSQHWQIFGAGPDDSCLSISLLPAIYRSIMNVDAEYLYKALYPLIFSLCPLIVYIISKKYVGNVYAFLAAFFFMLQGTFLWPAGRTNVAILFFALAIMVLVHDNINQFNKKALIIIFIASCIVSHYSSTYIFFLALLLSWIGIRMLLRITHRKGTPGVPPDNSSSGNDPAFLAQQPPARDNGNVAKDMRPGISGPRLKEIITITLVALFAVEIFLWYSQITQAPFNDAKLFVRETIENLYRFTSLEARGGESASILGAGLTERETPWKIEFALSWLTIAFIAIGVLSTVWRYKRMVSIPNSGNEKPAFLTRKIDAEYLVLSLACSALLVFSILIPYVLQGYSTNRMYFQMMAVLSPFFIIGGITIARWLRTRSHWVILAILVPYFMCTSGIMYQAFDFPRSVVLNSEGTDYSYLYIHDQDIPAAIWLRDNSLTNAYIYTDFTGENILVSQAGILESSINRDLLLQTDRRIQSGYIYLRYYNVVDGKLVDSQYESHDVAEYQSQFEGKSKIYDNGGSEIWIGTG